MNMKLLDLTGDAVIRAPDEMSQASGELEAEANEPKHAEIQLDKDRIYIVLSGEVHMQRSLESALSPGRSPLWPRSQEGSDGSDQEEEVPSPAVL